ncbi:MAG: hypothetical protein QNJ00_16265, partial [Woeseiaceae bacterium]|nr:hypothetical protein [Woeseiaceae bacterium]
MTGSMRINCAFLLLGSLTLIPAPAAAQEIFAITKFLPDDGERRDGFGNSVDVAGNYAVVAAPGLSAAYVFVRDGASWTQQAKLDAGWTWDEQSCRTTVATTGDIVVVGAEHDEILGERSRGSAYVYARNGTAWSLQARLLADDGAGGDRFGCSVAISDDVAVIGAPHDDYGPVGSGGSAYVFVRDGDSWSQQAKLLADDGESTDWPKSSLDSPSSASSLACWLQLSPSRT